MVAEANKALEWLAEKQRLQGTLRKTDDPVLLSSDMKKKEDTLVRFAEPILNKPPPPPPKVCWLDNAVALWLGSYRDNQRICCKMTLKGVAWQLQTSKGWRMC